MKFRVDARFDDQTIELYAKMMVYIDFKFDKKKKRIFFINIIRTRIQYLHVKRWWVAKV